jgi:hypothetical protein
MLRRLLGLRADEEDDRLIWDHLKEHVANKVQSPEREALYRFISTVPTRFEQHELDFLAANVLVLIKNICRREPMLLVFENIHWVPEGAEEELLIRLFQDTLVAADEPVLICAEFRQLSTSLRYRPNAMRESSLGPLTIMESGSSSIRSLPFQSSANSFTSLYVIGHTVIRFI